MLNMDIDTGVGCQRRAFEKQITCFFRKAAVIEKGFFNFTMRDHGPLKM